VYLLKRPSVASLGVANDVTWDRAKGELDTSASRRGQRGIEADGETAQAVGEYLAEPRGGWAAGRLRLSSGGASGADVAGHFLGAELGGGLGDALAHELGGEVLREPAVHVSSS
jgi:hypothetical protein